MENSKESSWNCNFFIIIKIKKLHYVFKQNLMEMKIEAMTDQTDEIKMK